MTELSWISKMKTYTSREIASSPVSVGFECLDREMFDPEKCYAPLGESGVKLARMQTGWNRCEKFKGVYDFAWLDDIVDNLAANGVESWFNVTFGNAIYMPDAPTPAAVGCMPLLFQWRHHHPSRSPRLGRQIRCHRRRSHQDWAEGGGKRPYYGLQLPYAAVGQ